MMPLDGFISGREIVTGVRAELSGLKTGQRVAFGREQVDALAKCPANVMRIPPANLLPAWQALQASFRMEYVAGFVRDIVSRDMSRWFLIQAANHSVEAAKLFEEAGARLVADAIVPRTVVNEVARRNPRRATA